VKTVLPLEELAHRAGLGDAQIHVWALSKSKHRDIKRYIAMRQDRPTRRSRGRWISDDGRWLYPASMIKLPLAVAAGQAIREGRLAWSMAAGVDEANMTANDAASPLVPGYRARIDELVTLMLQRSDNVATNVLYDLVGRERATADLHALGFRATHFRRKLSGAEPLIVDRQATGRNSFPAREAAALLTALAAGALPEARALRAILAGSMWNDKLSRGLAPGDVFAHKTGDTDDVAHDGGILRLAGGSAWTIVVYTDRPSGDATDRSFGAFMQALRPLLVEASQASEGAPTASANGAVQPLRME
jgi:beta-lactamase class A